MSSPVSPTPSKALPTFLGILAAFVSFALLAVILQNLFGGLPEDTGHKERLEKRAEIAKEQEALVAKYGLSVGQSEQAIAKSLESVKGRQHSTSPVVVPGSPTALKQAAAAPAPAEAAPAAPAAPAAAPAPAAPAPAPAAAPAPAPETPAAPAPAPATAPAAPAPQNPQ